MVLLWADLLAKRGSGLKKIETERGWVAVRGFIKLKERGTWKAARWTSGLPLLTVNSRNHLPDSGLAGWVTTLVCTYCSLFTSLRVEWGEDWTEQTSRIGDELSPFAPNKLPRILESAGVTVTPFIICHYLSIGGGPGACVFFACRPRTYKEIDAEGDRLQCLTPYVVATLIKTITTAHGFHSSEVRWQPLHLFPSGCTFFLHYPQSLRGEPVSTVSMQMKFAVFTCVCVRERESE